MTAKILNIELRQEKTCSINITQEVYDKLISNTTYISNSKNEDELNLSRNFFADNKKVPNVCRYLFKKENGKFKLNSFAEPDEEKYIDKDIMYDNELPAIVLVLESPHRAEYTKNTFSPIAPAQGETGCNLNCDLEQILHKAIDEKKINLSENKYRILLVNPIPFQTSLYEIHKQSLKGDFKTLRDDVWKILWENESAYKQKFKDVIKSVNTKIIINACTSNKDNKPTLSSLVQDEIDNIDCLSNNNKFKIGHPSSWHSKNRILNTLCFLFLFFGAFSQKYHTVFNEQFENNKNEWEIDSDSQSLIAGGKLIIEFHKKGYSSVNRIPVNINSAKDYRITFSIANLNYKNLNEYGFVWDFKDVNNYSCILFRQEYNGYSSLVTKYKVATVVAGNEIVHEEWKEPYYSLSKESSFNNITIERLGNNLKISQSIINQLANIPAEKWTSNKCGIIVGNGSKVVLDYLTIEERVEETTTVVSSGGNQSATEQPEHRTDTQASLQASSGSGIIVSKNGYIATNYHVIEGAQSIEVDVFNKGVKKTYPADVVSSDNTNDLAIIKIRDSNFSAGNIPYGIRPYNVKVAEDVVALGYPMIDIQGKEVKITTGIINSKTGYQNDPTTYQISAPIQPGNSGGPLFDKNGNLLGITNSGLDKSISSNVGYAIKASYLLNLLETISAIPSLPTVSTLTGKPLTQVVEKLSAYTVLIRINDTESNDKNAANNTSSPSQYFGGYTAEKITDYVYSVSSGDYKQSSIVNDQSELYMEERRIIYRRGDSQEWLYNMWEYRGYNKEKEVYEFFDGREQAIYINKNWDNLIYFYNLDSNTGKYKNCAVYSNMKRNNKVVPKK